MLQTGPIGSDNSGIFYDQIIALYGETFTFKSLRNKAKEIFLVPNFYDPTEFDPDSKGVNVLENIRCV